MHIGFGSSEERGGKEGDAMPRSAIDKKETPEEGKKTDIDAIFNCDKHNLLIYDNMIGILINN